jgi:molybdate transport system regulatory protein
MLKLKYKLWLDQDGKAFGDGPLNLLQHVDTTGSLNTAAKNMKMSYSQAYNLIKTLEKRLGFTLIESKIGGSGGGGSTLTQEAKLLMAEYENFSFECETLLQQTFEKYFTSFFKTKNDLEC